LPNEKLAKAIGLALAKVAGVIRARAVAREAMLASIRLHHRHQRDPAKDMEVMVEAGEVEEAATREAALQLATAMLDVRLHLLPQATLRWRLSDCYSLVPPI